MRAIRNIIVIIIAAALCVGILIFVLNEQGNGQANGGTDAPVTSGAVVINEFMASNGGCLIDDKGDNSDWIEVYNPSSEAVNLSGLGLSDDKSSVKWAFPNVTVEAGGYLVVFASGSSKNDPNGVLHAGFKLSADGGGVYLMDSAGKIIDEIEYEDQVKNVSAGRQADDITVWTTFNSPTPGYANNEAGAEAFQASRYATDSTLLITEVMASNNTTLTDNNGLYSDYIEIYNAGAEPVNLAGFGLSDDPQNVLDWKFPDVTIQPGAYLLVFASGAGVNATDLEKGAMHTGFGISSYEEVITLASPTGLILDQVTVSESQADTAYARVPSEGGAYAAEWAATSKPSPGYPNTDDGNQQFLAANPLALGDIMISEVMTSNSQYLAEDNGETYDWIELYNRGSQEINLQGYGLTDNTGNPAKFRLPDKTLAPGEYYTVLASGLASDESIKKNYVHTNFKLSATGEVLALFNADGLLQDKLNIDTLPRGISVGRVTQQDGVFYFTEPTPGAANANPSSGFVATPMPDVSPGSYPSAQTVTLSSTTQDASIYYTTDGSVPTTSSTPYTGPITMSETGMIRARAFKDGFLDSETHTATYIIGASHSLPVISLVANHDDLFNTQTGIYMLGPNAQLIEGHTEHYEVANYLEEGRESERPASFEVFDESGQRVFEQDVAIRIQGGFSRDNQQKSFAVMARSEYGKGSMAYPFFENLPFTEYKSLVLRGGGQDALYAKIKEAVILENMNRQKLNCLTQQYKTYVVYLNGEYWGVYFLEEKRNESFIAQHEGAADSKAINVLSGSGLNYVLNGTNDGYKELYEFITTHDMSIKENHEYLAERLDTDSYIDLMTNQIFLANSDYYNLQFYQVPGGKWKQIFYDMCWSFNKPDHPTLAARMKPETGGSTMFNALLAYDPWKKAFLERFAWTMENLYTTDNLISAIDEVAASVAAEMPAERAKFTDFKRDWEKEVESMRTFAKERPYNVLSQIKSVLGISSSKLRGYFSFTDEQMKTGFNLSDEQMQSLFG